MGELLVLDCAVTDETTAQPLALEKESEIPRRRTTLAKGKPERRLWSDERRAQRWSAIQRHLSHRPPRHSSNSNLATSAVPETEDGAALASEIRGEGCRFPDRIDLAAGTTRPETGGSMAQPDESDLVKSVESLLADKQAMAAREKKLIENLNAALGKMGYRVVPTKTDGAHAGRKPGRPPGSGKSASPKTT